MIKPRKPAKAKSSPRRHPLTTGENAAPNDPVAAQARILAAARREFIERGLGGARMRAIAIEAKVNSALLHYYFRTKQNLYEAALLDTVQSVWGRLEFPAPKATPADMPALLRSMMRLYLQTVLEQPDFPRFMLREILDGGRHIPLVQKAVAANSGVFFQNLVAALESAANEGRLRRIHPVDAVLNLAGMAIASVIFVLVSENMENPMIQNFRNAPDYQERRVEAIVTTFMDGLRVTT